jgi:hypothetical protein
MSTITRPPDAATNRDKSTTTQAAACGRPAPSSFETRVLYGITNPGWGKLLQLQR